MGTTNPRPPHWPETDQGRRRPMFGKGGRLGRLELSLVLGAVIAAGIVVVTGGFQIGKNIADDDTAAKGITSVSTSTDVPPPADSPVIAAPTPDAPPPGPSTDALKADLEGVMANWQGAAIVVEAFGPQPNTIAIGSAAVGPAWSTIKVPLAIAALRASNPPALNPNSTAAITQSDNAAAEAIWQSLGTPQQAAAAVSKVLSDTGFGADVPAEKRRPEFSAFGQTDWTLSAQVGFLKAAKCNPANQPVFDLMGEIAGGQRWGLGQLAGAQFKGGWGPDRGGVYLVRQMGVIQTDRGLTAVAVAVQPGSFDAGTSALTQIANVLQAHLAELPAGQC